MDDLTLYHYTPRTLPGPGVGNYAFQMPYHLPYQPLLGEGVHNLYARNVMQPPQVYKDTYRGPDYGYGGLSQGQYVGQPLTADNTYTAGG